MSTQNTIWVVISSQEIADKIRDGIDGGEFARVNDLTTYLDGFNGRIKSLVQQYGGHIFALLYDRTILEIPMTIAQMVPDLIAELKLKAGPVACGIGMDYKEAAHACRDSQGSGKIEMYGEDSDVVQKDDGSDETQDRWEGDFDPFMISPNLYNPEMQRTVQNIPDKGKKPKLAPVMRPEIDKELQIESQYLQAVGQSIAPPPPMPQPGQPGAQGEEEEPQDLLEALNGGKVPGHAPETDEDSEDPGEKSGNSEKDPGEKSEDSEEDGGSEKDDAQEKLANSLIGIRDRIPELMALADKNPEAFKQSMALIQKLVGLARQGKKETKKHEMDAINEKMDEMVKNLKLPVGTRRGKKKKVLIQGKQVWRSMSAGQVQDAQGEPVSVKSHNAAAATGSTKEQ